MPLLQLSLRVHCDNKEPQRLCTSSFFQVLTSTFTYSVSGHIHFFRASVDNESCLNSDFTTVIRSWGAKGREWQWCRKAHHSTGVPRYAFQAWDWDQALTLDGVAWSFWTNGELAASSDQWTPMFKRPLADAGLSAITAITLLCHLDDARQKSETSASVVGQWCSSLSYQS